MKHSPGCLSLYPLSHWVTRVCNDSEGVKCVQKHLYSDGYTAITLDFKRMERKLDGSHV